jgi:hypothetical protein
MAMITNLTLIFLLNASRDVKYPLTHSLLWKLTLASKQRQESERLQLLPAAS